MTKKWGGMGWGGESKPFWEFLSENNFDYQPEKENKTK